jgi:hypothetical protein
VGHNYGASTTQNADPTIALPIVYGGPAYERIKNTLCTGWLPGLFDDSVPAQNVNNFLLTNSNTHTCILCSINGKMSGHIVSRERSQSNFMAIQFETKMIHLFIPKFDAPLPTGGLYGDDGGNVNLGLILLEYGCVSYPGKLARSKEETLCHARQITYLVRKDQEEDVWDCESPPRVRPGVSAPPGAPARPARYSYFTPKP